MEFLAAQDEPGPDQRQKTPECLPTAEDFSLSNPSRLDPSLYTWAVPPPPPPSTPSPQRTPFAEDDGEDSDVEFRKRPRASKPNIPLFGQNVVRDDEGCDFGFQPGAVSQTQNRPPRPAAYTTRILIPPKSGLISIPLEIRNKIYREILVADKPFKVHTGWTQVYRRNKPNLDVRILRCSKQTYIEGIHILYGENVFLYLLRDATAPPPIRVDRLVNNAGRRRRARSNAEDEVDSDYGNDENNDGDDDDDDDDDGVYRDDNRDPSSRDAKMKNKFQGFEGDINFGKFSQFIRRVVLEAEHNRSSHRTLDSMAEAIKTLVKPPVWKPNASEATTGNKRNRRGKKAQQKDISDVAVSGPQESDSAGKCNIHTLTVRLHPTLDFDDQPGSARVFTSLDFLDPESSVIAVLKLLVPQYLRVEIMTKQLRAEAGGYAANNGDDEGEDDTNQASKRMGYRFLINLRHQRIIDRERMARRARQSSKLAMLAYQQQRLPGRACPPSQMALMSMNRCQCTAEPLYRMAKKGMDAMDMVMERARECCERCIPEVPTVDQLGQWDEFSDDEAEYDF